MRISFAIGFVCLSSPSFSEDPIGAAVRKDLNIPSEALDLALADIANQFDIQLLYHTEIVRGLKTAGAVGRLTLDAALDRVLAGTGLAHRYLGPDTVTVYSSVPTAKSSTASPSSPQGGGNPASQDFHQLDQRTSATDASLNASARVPSEILVTAQKREQRLQDVPVPVSVINTEDLLQNNRAQRTAYFSAVPGLNVTPVGNGGQTLISIRGISSGAYTPATVSITIDDIPTNSGRASIYDNLVPDLDPNDIARIEVLRGPQGTLYGASSMGGLIQYVTVDPSTAAASGRIEAGLSSVYNGNAPGYSLRGSANLPLNETLALRASVFTRVDPGYINNPVLDIGGVNQDRVSGGRVAVLWRPFDNVSAKFSALYQDLEGNGQNDVNVPTPDYPQLNGLKGLQQNYLRGTGGNAQKVQDYSVILRARLGSLDIVSLSGFSNNRWYSSQDISAAAGSLVESLYGVSGVALLSYGTDEKFTQEIRASMPLGSNVDWLVGGFYTHDNAPGEQSLPVVNPDTGAVVGMAGFDSIPATYIESAFFTDLTIHVTNRLEVQLGGRESRIAQRQNSPSVQGGLLIGPTLQTRKPSSTTNVFTYLLTPQYRVSPDLMIYARFASGFRPGLGFNYQHLTQPNIPAIQEPDKTRNYEIGVKGALLDQLFSYDASIYYIDWKRLQITLVDPVDSTGYGTNGSAAKSAGVEFALEARPQSGSTITGWATYDEAVLTKSLGADSTAYGLAGSRLPFGTRWSANISLEQDVQLTEKLAGFAGSTVSYVGNRYGTFLADSTPRQLYPGYVRTDVHAGLSFDRWVWNLYANNLFDRRGLSGGGLGTAPAFAIQYIRPRTIGMSLSAHF